MDILDCGPRTKSLCGLKELLTAMVIVISLRLCFLIFCVNHTYKLAFKM